MIAASHPARAGDVTAVGHPARARRRRFAAAWTVTFLGAAVVAGCGAPSSERQGIELIPLGSPTATAAVPSSGGWASAGPTSSWGPSTRGLVTRVVDGDTVDVEGLGRVRVLGIDTPERGECGFESATAALSVLVLGREVLAVPGERSDADRYGRKLRYLDVVGASGRALDAGLRLIEDGWAIARYDSLDGYPKHDRQDQYRAADATSEDRGCYPDNGP